MKTFVTSIGNAMEDQIVRVSHNGQYPFPGPPIPGSPEDRFLHGDRAKVIEEQYAIFKKFGDTYATAKTAGYVQNKNAAQAAQPRTLPASNAPVATPATQPNWRDSDARAKKLKAILEQETV